MKKNLTKVIISAILCVCLLSAMCINIFAYQADAVHAYDYFPDGTTDCHGYLYVIATGSGSEPALGTAETEVSVRTNKISELYVEYFFDEYNTALIDVHSCYAPSGYRITPSFDDQVEGYNADSLQAYHKVVYTVSASQRVIWEGNTIEYDDFG